VIVHDTQYLSGKVLKRSLPAFPPPITSNLSEKRLLLPQGELAQFYNGEQPIRYIAAVEFTKGTARGHHYHHRKQEWLYLFSGVVCLVVEDMETKARESLLLTKGDLVFIPPNIAHAFIVQEDGIGIEFSPTLFDPADTFKYPLT
jgi:oxalate decarboxylase/phosphoglucose isomerase-like protein (cupin superfamily)